MSCNINDFLIYLIADAAYAQLRPLTEIVEEAVGGGVTAVQYRDKEASQRERIERAGRLKEITDRYGVPLIVNDHLDVALAAGAAGVHVGQDDMPVEAVRRVGGDDLIVGVSARTVEQARLASLGGADYVGFGPIFPTRTKRDASPVAGMDRLRAIVAEVDIPVIAIGGISRECAASVIGAGAAGVAVAAAIAGDEDPRAAAMRFRESLNVKG